MFSTPEVRTPGTRERIPSTIHIEAYIDSMLCECLVRLRLFAASHWFEFVLFKVDQDSPHHHKCSKVCCTPSDIPATNTKSDTCTLRLTFGIPKIKPKDNRIRRILLTPQVNHADPISGQTLYEV